MPMRAVFGSRPLAVTVDFHANLSHRMVALADVVVGYKTYPHVDPYERAREAYALLTRMLRGEVRPISHLEKPPPPTVPPAQRTDSRPMRDLIARAREVKGAIAWQTGFGDLVQGQIYVDGPGICTVHLDRLPFRHPRRPVFPLDSF